MNRACICVGLLYLLLSFGLGAQQSTVARYFSGVVANDVFYLPIKTDRYFTSGVQFEYGITQAVSSSVLPGLEERVSRYWRVNHHLYTPSAIDSSNLQVNDRPFASYLTISRGKIYQSEVLGLRLEQLWTIGVLGKYSGGGRIQNAFHEMVKFAEPIPGWTHEVAPDFILNYQLSMRQDFPLLGRFVVAPSFTIRAGTLYTDISGGFFLSGKLVAFSPRRFLRLGFGSDLRFVGYDATLSGGLLNRDERYRGVIQPRRIVGQFQLRGSLHFDGWRGSAGLAYLSKEFTGGWSHTWAWFGLSFEL
ncbi:MAG: lipid A-modifier LpxR family protein [Bacteroidota bacterium]